MKLSKYIVLLLICLNTDAKSYLNMDLDTVQIVCAYPYINMIQVTDEYVPDFKTIDVKCRAFNYSFPFCSMDKNGNYKVKYIRRDLNYSFESSNNSVSVQKIYYLDENHHVFNIKKYNAFDLPPQWFFSKGSIEWKQWSFLRSKYSNIVQPEYCSMLTESLNASASKELYKYKKNGMFLFSTESMPGSLKVQPNQ